MAGLLGQELLAAFSRFEPEVLVADQLVPQALILADSKVLLEAYIGTGAPYEAGTGSEG